MTLMDTKIGVSLEQFITIPSNLSHLLMLLIH